MLFCFVFFYCAANSVDHYGLDGFTDLVDYESDLLASSQLPDFVTSYLDSIKKHLLNMTKTKSTVEVSQLLNKAEILVDYAWEKLNTNLWVFVDQKWRYLYGYATLYKILLMVNKDTEEEEVIKLCDLGLLMSGSLLEKQFNLIINSMRKNELNEGVVVKKARYSREVDESVNITVEHALTIEVSPSIELFRENYFLKSVPVIVDKQMEHWPALHKWSIEYIQKIAGKRTVPIEIGSKYTADDWSQKLMTINEFIDKFILNEKNTGYLAQHPLFDQIPELKDDIYVPEYCRYLTSDDDIDANVDINAWFGPKGTVSPLHQDPKHNFLCQVIGSKYVRLYDDKYRECLYPHREKILQNTSEVDLENLDVEKYPLIETVPYWEGILREGQMLYIPPKCWHHIKSLSLSFSVSFWWN